MEKENWKQTSQYTAEEMHRKKRERKTETEERKLENSHQRKDECIAITKEWIKHY